MNSGANPRSSGADQVPGTKTFRLPVLKEAPPGVHVLHRPDVVHVAEHGNHYLCGHCGTLLVVALASQLHNLIIECRGCGTLNDVQT
jgi:hypothetical protein